MKMSLLCRGYRIFREVHEPVKINADLVLVGVRSHDIAGVSAALSKIEKMLAGGVDLVKAEPDKSRCFYCACLNEKDNNVCSQCGAPL